MTLIPEYSGSQSVGRDPMGGGARVSKDPFPMAPTLSIKDCGIWSCIVEPVVSMAKKVVMLQKQDQNEEKVRTSGNC